MLARHIILEIIFRNKFVIFLSFSVNILCSEFYACQNAVQRTVSCRPQQHHAMIQAVSLKSVTVVTWVRSQDSPCGICGGQSGLHTGLSPSSSFLPLKQHTHTHTHTHTNIIHHRSSVIIATESVVKQHA